MNLHDKILKTFAKNLQYNEEARQKYISILSSYYNQMFNFDDALDYTHYWMILFLYKMDTILVVNSANRHLFVPKFRNQIGDYLMESVRRNIPIQNTMTGFRIFGKEYPYENDILSDAEVYLNMKFIIDACADVEVFKEFIQATINDLSMKEPKFFRNDFPRFWAKKLKWNHIDESIEIGFLNYIRRGGVYADAMVKNANKFETNKMGFNVFIWHIMWKKFKETAEYKMIYKELEKVTNR